MGTLFGSSSCPSSFAPITRIFGSGSFSCLSPSALAKAEAVSSSSEIPTEPTFNTLFRDGLRNLGSSSMITGLFYRRVGRVSGWLPARNGIRWEKERISKGSAQIQVLEVVAEGIAESRTLQCKFNGCDEESELASGIVSPAFKSPAVNEPLALEQPAQAV